MLLARFLNNLFRKGGFFLEDAFGRRHIIGTPDKNEPIELKLNDKSLH